MFSEAGICLPGDKCDHQVWCFTSFLHEEGKKNVQNGWEHRDFLFIGLIIRAK